MGIWVCEYSPKQKAFHIDTLDRILAANRQTVAQGLEPGYVPLYASVTSEDARDFAAKWAAATEQRYTKTLKNFNNGG